MVYNMARWLMWSYMAVMPATSGEKGWIMSMGVVSLGKRNEAVEELTLKAADGKWLEYGLRNRPLSPTSTHLDNDQRPKDKSD